MVRALLPYIAESCTAQTLHPHARATCANISLADLEWKIIYVGSAASSDCDQELDCVLVGPVPIGTSKFVLSVRNYNAIYVAGGAREGYLRSTDLQTPPPDHGRIPEDDILGATVVLITCSYKNQEFIRVGYWINNTYGESLPEGMSVPLLKSMSYPSTHENLLQMYPSPDLFHQNA
jgi:hypothetical protein